MKYQRSILLLVLCVVTEVAVSQTRIESKLGENTLFIEIYNRTQDAFPEFMVRFAQDGPAWLFPRDPELGRIVEYKGESTLRKNKTRLEIPFGIGAEYDTKPVKLEILNGETVIGTFDVLLSFSDRPGSTIAGGEAVEGTTQKGLEIAIPEAFALRQNYPNPFNPTTNIQFDLPIRGQVSLKVYDLLGQEIRTLVRGERSAGFHTVSWDSRNESGQAVPSGVYIYKIVVSDFTNAQKMLLVR